MSESASNIEFLSVVPQFTVPDLVRTVEYYRDIFGFQIAGCWDGQEVSLDPGPAHVFAIVWRGQVQVFFSRAGQHDARTGRAEDAYDAYFRVTGVDELAAELRRRGADIVDGPTDRVYGQREVVVRDCNGLVLAFGEDISQRAT